MTIEKGALVLRRTAKPVRRVGPTAQSGDDELLIGEFANAEDTRLVWWGDRFTCPAA